MKLEKRSQVRWDKTKISGTCEKKGQKYINIWSPPYEGSVQLQWPGSDLFAHKVVRSTMLDATCSATAALKLKTSMWLHTCYKLEKWNEVPVPERPIAYIWKIKVHPKIFETASHATNTACLSTFTTLRFVPEWRKSDARQVTFGEMNLQHIHVRNSI